MRTRYIALLLLSGLLGCVSPAPAVSTTAKDVTTPSQLHATSDDQVHVSVPKRMLRTYNTATDGIEERGIVASLIKEGAASAANAAMLKTWLHRGKSAVEVLVKLKLNERVDDALASPRGSSRTGITIREDGYNVMDRKLETLREYINLYNAQNPQAKTNTFKTLAKCFGGGAEFALVIGRARQLPESETVYWEAFVFEQELFKKWMRDDLDPMSVLINIFKTDESNLAGAPLDVKSIIAEYRAFFNRGNRRAGSPSYGSDPETLDGYTRLAMSCAASVVITITYCSKGWTRNVLSSKTASTPETASNASVMYSRFRFPFPAAGRGVQLAFCCSTSPSST